MSTTILITMLVLFALSVPIAVSIGLASVVGIAGFTNLPLLLVAQQLFVSLDRYPLAAIPFFILAGNLMEVGGISTRLVDFAKSIVGGIQGGLACTCVLTCMIFAAVSGSSVATTFAIGAILIPAMVRHGYPAPFAAALQATSAELGVIIPPSIPMILYAVSAEVSIGELFIAGIGPGILIAAALTLFVYVWCRIKGLGRNDREGQLKFTAALKRSALALLMPVVIIGGIYGGVFTPTEASVVAVFYALVVGMVIYREIRLRRSGADPAEERDFLRDHHVHHRQCRAVQLPDQPGRRARSPSANGWSRRSRRAPASCWRSTPSCSCWGCSSKPPPRSSCWRRSWLRSPAISGSIRSTSV